MLLRPAGPRRARPAGEAPRRADLRGAGPGGRLCGRALRGSPSPRAPPAHGAPLQQGSSSPIAAWFAKRPSSSISASVNRTSSERSRTARTPAPRPHGAAARPSAASARSPWTPRPPPEPRVALDVLDDQGLPRRAPSRRFLFAGKRRPTSSSEPCPATASKTSSPAASSSRKIDDAFAQKIARAGLDDRLEGGRGAGSSPAGGPPRQRHGTGRRSRSGVHVGRGEVEHALQLKRRRPGCFERERARRSRHVRGREAVAGAAGRGALEPRRRRPRARGRRTRRADRGCSSRRTGRRLRDSPPR